MRITSRKNGKHLLVVVFALFALALPAFGQQGWMPAKVAPPGQDLNTVFFLDNKRGWVGGDNGFLNHTEDGGPSWVQQIVDTKAPINDIYFRDQEAGFLITANSIFVTKDNGTRWTEVRRFLSTE